MLGRRITRAAVAAALVAGVLATNEVRPGAAAACTLAPVLRETTVNQGLGSYSPLVHGKETIVRVFLSKPNCAAGGDRIELTAAALSVAGRDAPIPATRAIGEPYPLVPDAPVAPLNDGSGDPKFVIPGESVQSATGTLALTPRLSYRATSAAGAVSTGTVALATTSAPVAKRSNDLNILVVPMGATSSPYVTQFPPAASTALQNGMTNLGRTLPVRDGVADLAQGSTTPAGLRYTVLPTLLDVGPTGANAMKVTPSGLKFCGNGSSFAAIAQKLAEARQAWNSLNPSAPAQLAVGAVWQDISMGAADGGGCDEGRAWLVGTEAWVRVTSDTAGGAAMTGPVLEMEVMHNIGSIPVGNVRHGGGYHSLNTEADVTAPNRAYNTALRQYLPDDRSALRFSLSGWTNRNVLLEKEDWQLAHCKLTPGASCPTPGTLGTASAGTHSFTLAGAIRDVAAGLEQADVHSAWIEGAVQRGAADLASPYSVVQLDNRNRPVRTDFITYQEEKADHHGDGQVDPVHSHDRVIDVAVPAADAAAAFELRSGTRTLHRRERGVQPDIVSPIAPPPGELRNRTASVLDDDRDPALSTDGTVLAWSTAVGIRVARADGTGTTATVAGSDPALVDAADGTRRLAFVRGGNVHIATVTASAGGVSVSGEQLVYLAAAQALPGSAAARPSWSPAADTLAVEIGGATWLLDVGLLPGTPLVCDLASQTGVGPCRKLADDATSPSWSGALPGRANGRIAAERGGTVLLLDPDVVGGAPQATGLAGSRPTFGGPLLAFASTAGGISVVDARAAVPADPLPLTSGADASPALSGNGRLLAFDRGPAGAGDVMLLDLGAVGTISFAARGGDATLLRADVIIGCASSLRPVLTGLRPVVRDNVAYFNAPYDSTPACRPADILARVTNGYLTTTEKVGEIDDLGPAPEGPPVPAIAAPYDGSELFQYDAIPISGTGRDHDNHDDVTLQWSLTGPAGSGIVDLPLGSGSRLPDKQPPRPSGWAPGEYTVKLTATDAEGRSASTAVRVVILEDKDGDRISVDRELPCLGGGGDLDPTNAYGDPDFDVIASLQDADPCTSAETGTADFEPNTLYVPSSGNTVTVFVRGAAVAGVDRTTVLLERVAGYTVRLPALSWSVDSAGVGTAKFDKQKLNAIVSQVDLIGLYVPMVVTARGTAGNLIVHDRNAPVTSPGN